MDYLGIRLRRTASMASLFVALWFTILWGRGYSYDEGISWGTGSHRWMSISNEPGHIRFGWGHFSGMRSGFPKLYSGENVDPHVPSQFLGFYLDSGLGSGRFDVPLWAIILPAAGSFFFWEWRRIEAKKKIRGHCTTCGYNLRSITTASCPECGAAVPATVTVASLVGTPSDGPPTASAPRDGDGAARPV
ncbi:MAG: hypothetical protein K8S99_03965 [Planctomycetes bacterium]|nr:hypothetical protein [Planctomycetota bacterium]